MEYVLWRAHDLRCFSSLRNVIILCGTNNLYHDSPQDIANGLIKIGSCFKQGNNAINVFICGILPRDGTSSINCQLIKETNNILKSSCSVNHINFIDQDANWIQMNGCLKPDTFYSDKLHLVEKGNLILAKSIYISVRSYCEPRNNYQPIKTYKSVTIFSLNKADFSTLKRLSPRKTVSDCVSVSPYKSVHSSFVKPVQKPSYTSSIKPISLVVRKCSVYDSSLGARKECVPVSVNHAICKASATHFSESAVNVRRKVFRVVLSCLPISAVPVPPVNVVQVTTTPTYQYTNPASKQAMVSKPVFRTSHVITTPAPAVVTLNSALPLHVFDVPVPPNLSCHVRKFFPPIPLSADLANTSRLYALRKSVFYDYNFKCTGISLQASFSMLITLLFHVILTICYSNLSRNLTNYINQQKYFMIWFFNCFYLCQVIKIAWIINQ